MLDLLDVAKRIGPTFPLKSMLLDLHEPEWEDDMTYLYVDYQLMKQEINNKKSRSHLKQEKKESYKRKKFG